MIIHITAQAISTPTVPKPNLNKANWPLIQHSITDNMQNINPEDSISQAELNYLFSQWSKSITSAIDSHTPKTTPRITHKMISNTRIKELQWWYKNLIENSLVNGWTHSKYIAYKTIKNKTVKESRQQKTGKRK